MSTIEQPNTVVVYLTFVGYDVDPLINAHANAQYIHRHTNTHKHTQIQCHTHRIVRTWYVRYFYSELQNQKGETFSVCPSHKI